MTTPRAPQPSRPSRPAAAPLSAAQQWQRQQQQQALLRLGGVAAIILIVIIWRAPSPIAGVAWRPILWAQIGPFLLQPFPDAPTRAALPIAVGVYPLLQWLQWLACLAGGWWIVGALRHLAALRAQLRRPLTATHSTLLIRLPRTSALTPVRGSELLRTLHGMLPPVVAERGDPTPIILTWTAHPDQPIDQAIRVRESPVLLRGVQQALLGLAPGTQAVLSPDPLAAACTDTRVLAWADAQMQGAAGVPLPVIDGNATPILDALLPALACAPGVALATVQLLLAPIRTSAWRMPTVALREQRASDVQSAEKRAIDGRLAGPAFRTTVRVLVVGDDAESAQRHVAAIGNAFAATAQQVGGQTTRLALGPVQVAPAALPPPAPYPRRQQLADALLGLLGGIVAYGGAAAARLPIHTPLQIGLVVTIVLGASVLPGILRRTHHDRRTGGPVWRRLMRARSGALPVVNPNTMPLIGAWFGPTDGGGA